MEEEALFGIDAAEELPVAVQRRIHHAISRTHRKSLQSLAEFARIEDREHHKLVEVRTVTLDARPFAYDRVSAVTTYNVIGLQEFVRAVPCFMNDADADTGFILRDILGGPAEPRIDQWQACHPPAQDGFETILWQAIVPLEVIVVEDFAALKIVPVVAHQAPIGDDACGRHLWRQQTLCAHLVHAAPEIEMLECALCQVLALRMLCILPAARSARTIRRAGRDQWQARRPLGLRRQ